MTNHRRWIALLLCAIVTISSVSVLADNTPAMEDPLPSAEAGTEETAPLEPDEAPADGGEEAPPALTEPQDPLEPDPSKLKITLNDTAMELDIEPVLHAGTTFVSLRSFCEAMGCTVTWSNGVTTVTKGEELKMTISANNDLVQANDRFFYMPDTPVNINGTLMVPIRGLSKVFSLEVGWNEDTRTVSLTGGQIMAWARDYYNETDLLWLSRIIHAESQGESLEGKIAVGNVILNRTKASQFPDTIYDVIFDKKFGTQFTPTKTGKINNTPNDESVLAAKLCLEGHTVIEKGLYFLNTARATSNWITKNRAFVVKIGCHSFYA